MNTRRKFLKRLLAAPVVAALLGPRVAEGLQVGDTVTMEGQTLVVRSHKFMRPPTDEEMNWLYNEGRGRNYEDIPWECSEAKFFGNLEDNSYGG